MSGRQASRLEELRAQVEARGQLDQHHRGVREQLVEAQYRLRGLELQVQQAEMAVRGLEGFNLDSLVLGLLGRKAQRLEQARQLKSETERQYTECTEAVTTLEREMAEAERQIKQIDSVRQEYDSLLAAKRERIEQDDGEAASELHQLADEREAASSTIKAFQRAIDAGEEAESTLRTQSSTTGRLGRCQVADGCAELSLVMNVGRQNTANQCVQRVSSAIRRFQQRLDEAITQHGPDADAHLVEMTESLQRIAQDFTAGWFGADDGGDASEDYVSQQLSLATALLDRQLTAAKERAANLESRQESLVASV